MEALLRDTKVAGFKWKTSRSEPDGNVTLAAATATLEPFAVLSRVFNGPPASSHEPGKKQYFKYMFCLFFYRCPYVLTRVSILSLRRFVFTPLVSSVSEPCWGFGSRLGRCVSLHWTPATLLSSAQTWGRESEGYWLDLSEQLLRTYSFISENFYWH